MIHDVSVSGHRSSNHDTRSISAVRMGIKTGVFHRHFGSGHSKLTGPVHPPEIFFLDKILGLKIFDFTGETGGKSGSIKRGNRGNAGLSGFNRFPKSFFANAISGNDAYSSDY